MANVQVGDTVYYEHFRESHIGQSLLESLDALVTSGQISAGIAQRTMLRFDRIIAETLVNEAGDACVKITGHLDYYQEVYPQYHFMVENPLVKMGPGWKMTDRKCDEAVEVRGNLRIVAMKAERNLRVTKDEPNLRAVKEEMTFRAVKEET